MTEPSGLPQSILVSAMWSYAAAVLNPAEQLRRAAGPPQPHGNPPVAVPSPGLGPRFSTQHSEPELLEDAGDHGHLVEEFDEMAEVYDSYVRPFSTPIFSVALSVIAPILPREARVLDAGCGPGRQLKRMSRLVPDGEVVGLDLAAGMVEAARRSARAAGCDNTAFYQADVGLLPEAFGESFDLVYNCLAHHHFPEPTQAAAEALRCLRPGGTYAVIDPGPSWYINMAAPLARWADPGWVGFHTPAEFTEVLKGVGFARVAWYDLLPGFQLILGQRDHN